ncbi:hypothetical protein FKP32DRAFT_1106445 [Trametes sanguinea]|nr:hypothetical protein FKP32DRAFT_1106445 [Trametes sanguinea]
MTSVTTFVWRNSRLLQIALTNDNDSHRGIRWPPRIESTSYSATAPFVGIRNSKIQGIPWPEGGVLVLATVGHHPDTCQPRMSSSEPWHIGRSFGWPSVCQGSTPMSRCRLLNVSERLFTDFDKSPTDGTSWALRIVIKPAQMGHRTDHRDHKGPISAEASHIPPSVVERPRPNRGSRSFCHLLSPDAPYVSSTVRLRSHI